MDNQRRNHFRVEYPPSEMPRLRIGDEVFSVKDLSEKGIRFLPSRSSKLTPGQGVKGSVTFTDGVSYIILGHVLRTQNGDIVLNLDQGVPFSRMLEEQRRLIQQFGKKAV